MGSGSKYSTEIEKDVSRYDVSSKIIWLNEIKMRKHESDYIVK